MVAALREIAARAAAEHGVEVVEVALGTGGPRWVVRVDVDRAGPGGVTLDDCQAVSRLVGDAIERSDLLESAYTLEVSSPGLDRPIRSADDIRRNTGRRIELATGVAVNGRTAFRGVLRGLRDGRWILDDDACGELAVRGDCVVRARQELPF
jgi:ribosome maturation factor RimP